MLYSVADTYCSQPDKYQKQMDPLHALPAEIVLRIIDFVDIAGTASLTRTCKAWHQFIDNTHQEIIYSSPSKTGRQSQDRDLDFLEGKRSFAKYYDGIASWKELCKRTTLLERNWTAESPTTRESTIQVGNDPVWRFRADFGRRFIVSTSHGGGLNVTDMDSGRLLWHLEDVRPYAHLEYDMNRGIAVFDRFGNSVEVWRADDGDRGSFKLVTVLHHDCETRGYQLSYDTLCVVSTEGQGFVYNMEPEIPCLVNRISIETEAVGHLDQNEDTVMYSMGSKGYHLHAKTEGSLLGTLHPKHCKELFHIRHPAPDSEDIFSLAGRRPQQEVWPPKNPRKDRLAPLKLERGPHPDHESLLSVDEDEWGAGMLFESFMVGVSKAGRVFICSDWRGAVQSSERYAQCSAIIECESDGSTFDLGGWLSIRDNHVLFEIDDRVYVFTLTDPAQRALPLVGEAQPPIYALSQSSTPRLSIPVSFMAVWDDCLMLTYATLGFREQQSNGHFDADDGRGARLRAFPTKVIRVISLAPALYETNDEAIEKAVQEQDLRGAVDRMSRPATALEILLLSNLDQV